MEQFAVSFARQAGAPFKKWQRLVTDYRVNVARVIASVAEQLRDRALAGG